MTRDLGNDEDPKAKPEDDDNEIDGFLSHSSSDRGGGYVGNWKKDGKLNVFLHTRRKPLPIWYHTLPRRYVKEDDAGETVTHIYTGKHVCHEEEAVLKKQYKYGKDDARLLPPRRCPLCLLVEEVRTLVNQGKLRWTQTLFNFAGDVPDEEKTIHAGGMIGEFGGDSLSDKEKKALKDAGIRRDEAWAENFRAKLSYVFWVVDADNPSKGLLTATETGLLGDKVKDVINDVMEGYGEAEKDKGNPLKNPYCIQWEFRDEKGLPFNKKYAARPLPRIKLTPDIEALIRSPRPDSSKIEELFDGDAMRSLLEAAATPEARAIIPWDDCFRPRRASASKDEDQDADDPHPAAKGGDGRDVGPEGIATPDEDGDETCACDNPACKKIIKLSDPRCPHCGKEYEVEVETKADPEPAKVRSRSEMKAEKEKQAGAVPKGKLPF